MMTTSLNSLGLPETAFQLLRDLVHERLGIFYTEDNREIFGDKLAALVINRGFDNFLDYYYLLKYDATAAAEWDQVINALSVQETYFMRETDQIDALVNVIVPMHAKERPAEPLRIWSAACATGEEPLSIAMRLDELGWFHRAPIEILASDISTAALEKAQRGVYRQRSFRQLTQKYIDRYFQPGDEGWHVDSGLRQRIQWRRANLTKPDEFADLATAHVIFCRNMFIYFSDDKIRSTLKIFAQQMLTPGYLFVGVSESLLRLTKDFALTDVQGAFAYVRE